MYIVYHSATMLKIGPCTFLEDEDEISLDVYITSEWIATFNSLGVYTDQTTERFSGIYLFVSSVGNICKWFGSRSGPTKSWV